MQECGSHIAVNTLAREQRIQKRKEFLRVQRFGVRSFGRFVVAISQAEKPSPGRLGITVPKKVGPAHARNKIKRRIRHIFRHNKTLLLNKSLVIVAKEAASKALFSELTDDIMRACQKFNQKNPTSHKTYTYKKTS